MGGYRLEWVIAPGNQGGRFIVDVDALFPLRKRAGTAAVKR